jgi:hypothetical protein
MSSVEFVCAEVAGVWPEWTGWYYAGTETDPEGLVIWMRRADGARVRVLVPERGIKAAMAERSAWAPLVALVARKIDQATKLADYRFAKEATGGKPAE